MKTGFSLVVSTLALILASMTSQAADVTNFSVRGIKPGVQVMEACTTLAPSFGDERSMKDRLGIPRMSKDYRLNVDSQIHPNSLNNEKRCIGGYKLYDHNVDGAMTRHDYIEVESNNGQVFFVKNSQTLKVGNEIKDCTQRRTTLINGLISEYGKPTTKRSGKQGSATYEYLLWNYSTEPDLIQGDPNREDFKLYIQCEMYTYGALFAVMKTETQLHSGKTMAAARKKLTSEKSFEPNL